MFLKKLKIDNMNKNIEDLQSSVISDKKFPPIMYGLQGIMDLFGVKKTTAWRYHKGIIADACTKRGRTILIDTRKALTLFGINPDELVNNDMKV